MLSRGIARRVPTRRSPIATLVTMMAIVVSASLGLASAPAGAEAHLGQPLAEALDGLRQEGVAISYSTALVRPEMRVVETPAGLPPAALLEALLAPHGLMARLGSRGTWLVVRRPAPPPAAPPQSASVPAASAAAAGEIRPQPAGAVAETIEVHGREVAETAGPQAAALERVVLESLPAARAPWSFATRAPGVLSDRVDVGGSARGEQPTLVAPAGTRADNRYSVDGVDTTDMNAVGTSAVYYDLEQFETVAVSTGGTDVTTPTAGVSVRMVTKRGTDRGRASGRWLRAAAGGVLGALRSRDRDLGGSLTPGRPALVGNRVDSVAELGVEGGGPLVPGRLWGWLAASRTDVVAFAADGASDDTHLDYQALKLNVRLGDGHSGVASVLRSEKRKPSRGAGPGRAFETTFRQAGPTAVVKLEDTGLLAERLSVTGHVSYVDSGFSLVPQAGLGPEGGEAVWGGDGVWRGGMRGGVADRDSARGQLDGALHVPFWGGDHSLTFGVSHRRYAVADRWVWPGPHQAHHMTCELFGTCGAFGSGDVVSFQRTGTPRVMLAYDALWLQDTVRWGRFTVDLGLRADRQRGHVRAGSVPANPAVPEVLPALEVARVDGGFEWRTLSPRLAVAVTLGESRRTRLRLGFARFAQQLGAGTAARLSPITEAYADYYFDDRNGDDRWQRGEPLALLGVYGVDPARPGALLTPNRTDPGLEPEGTDELTLGVERALGGSSSAGGLVLGADLTWRRVTGIHEEQALVFDPAIGGVRPASRADYQPDIQTRWPLPDGTSRWVPTFALVPQLSFAGGTSLRNGARARVYRGATVRLERRLADRWMVRAQVTAGTARWRVPASFAAQNDPTDLLGGGDDDGALHAEQVSSPARDSVFLQSDWSASIDGLVRVAPRRRWGFTVSASVFARQGYPLPYYRTRWLSDGLRREIQIAPGVDAYRLGDVVVADLHLEKDLALGRALTGRGLRATVGLDVFNLFDRASVLRREVDLSSGRGGEIEETLAPRVARLGVRLRWR